MRTLPLVFLLTMFVVPALFAQEGLEVPGEGSFKERCGQCHSEDDPAGPASTQWLTGVDAPLVELTTKQKEDVLRFLQHHGPEAVEKVSVARDRALFDEKCNLCHSADRMFIEPLSAAEKRVVVTRMQERAPDWLSPREMEIILNYLDKGAPGAARPGESTSAYTPAELFRERCSNCHELERVYLHLDKGETTADSWMLLVARMRAKAPDLISDEEGEKILNYIRGLAPVH